MLISQVFNQENIDVRPYRVDHMWYFARYEGDNHKKEYYNVSYRLFSQPKSKISPTMAHSIRKYHKYTYSTMTEMKLQHVRFYFNNFLCQAFLNKQNFLSSQF